MSRTFGMLAAIALAIVARADVRVFVTTSSAGYGLENPANAFQPTFSTVDVYDNNTNACDYANGHFRCSSYPPIDAPSGTAADPVEIAAGDWAYIWLQFRTEPKGSKINGLEIAIRTNGAIAPLVPTYYVQNNVDDPSYIAYKRWDGTATPPEYTEWHNNPQTLVAITAAGLVGRGDYPWNMQMGQPTGGGSVVLLGAVPVPADGITYEIAITQIEYAGGGEPNGVGSGYFAWIPEPSGLLLLTTLGVLLRRR